MGMNFIVLAGRLASDPELKYTQDGKAFARFSLAVARTHNREEADFINCTAWGKTAEVAGEYLRKGSMVGVQGALRVSRYEQDGQKRSRTVVQINTLEFLDSKKNAGSGDKSSSRDVEDFEEYQESSSSVNGSDDDFPF
jgi:single-strand DNA-binding protein